MKRLITLSLTVAFAATMSASALACGWGKMAKHETMTTASSTSDVKTEEAMSTFDPAILDSETPKEDVKKPVSQ